MKKLTLGIRRAESNALVYDITPINFYKIGTKML